MRNKQQRRIEEYQIVRTSPLPNVIKEITKKCEDHLMGERAVRIENRQWFLSSWRIDNSEHLTTSCTEFFMGGQPEQEIRQSKNVHTIVMLMPSVAVNTY